MDFVIDNLRLPQVEQYKHEKEEMHAQESSTFCLEASKDDKVSNCFPLSNLSFQMLGNSFLLSSWCGGLCSL